MLVWDNQQATSSWFSGILEGEGSFRNTKKSNVEVRISNTDLDIISTCEKFLKDNYIIFNTYESNRINRRIEYTISIRDSREFILSNPQMLFKKIEPFLECRIEEYQQILGASQTARSPSIDLYWLIGIFEAEGSFSIVLNNRNNAAIKVELPNTNQRIIEKVACNFRYLKCPYYIETRNKKEVHHSQAKAVTIYGMKRSLRFLEATENKWLSNRKKKITSLILEFIRTRLETNRKESYTTRQLQIIQTVRDLNR